MNTSILVQKLWKYCNVLRDEGMSYRQCVEQLTYLLFQKMVDERNRVAAVASYRSVSLVADAEIKASLKRSQSHHASRFATTSGCSGNLS